MPIIIEPLPIEENKQLLLAARDIMRNGSRIPQDVSNELIMAAMIDVSTCVNANENLSRKNAHKLNFVSVGLVIVSLFVAALHASEVPVLTKILAAIGLN
jgi:hypothetical protein